MPRYWLMKSEPSEVSIDDLVAAPGQTLPWTGVRNYQARNFMRDDMRVGDGVLFYHSSCPEPGVAGLAALPARPAPTRRSSIRRATTSTPSPAPDNPRWVQIDVTLTRKTRLLPLREMRATPELATMRVLATGNRLSITPVTPQEWRAVGRLLAR